MHKYNGIGVGSYVRKKHPCDGSPRAGSPRGPVLKVVEVVDNRPIDGPVQKDSIALLDDGTWEFIWNLVEERRSQ